MYTVIQDHGGITSIPGDGQRSLGDCFPKCSLIMDHYVVKLHLVASICQNICSTSTDDRNCPTRLSKSHIVKADLVVSEIADKHELS